MIAGITRQAMYINRNNEVCSCSHSCSGKAISITGIYSECVCVCSPYPACKIFPHYLINGTIKKI